MFKDTIECATSIIPQIDANMVDNISIPLSAEERMEQEDDTERQLKTAFLALWAKLLATLKYAINNSIYILCPLLSPLFYNAYSSTFKLQGFNKTLKNFNISIPAWGVIILVLISTIVYGFYSTLPFIRDSKDQQPSPQKTTQPSFNSLFVEFKKKFKYEHPLKILAEALVLISLVFFVWTTGANAYDIFSGGSKTSALIIASLCALGAAMGTLIVVFRRVPKAFPHIFNPYKWKKLYKGKTVAGIALVIQAIIQLPLFMVLSLGKMPWYFAIGSSILTTIITYTMSVGGLCPAEIADFNNSPEGMEDISSNEQRPNKNYAIKEKFDETSWTNPRFIIAATLYFIYCAITGVGAVCSDMNISL